MKRILYIFTIIALYACTGDPLSEPIAPSNPVSVTINIIPASNEQITRATDEDTITDVNVYLVGKNNSIYQHFYNTNTSLHFECVPGKYKIYLAANVHSDMGALPVSSIESYFTSHQDAFTDLPMSTIEEIEISDSQTTLKLPAIEVKRNVAKINYNIAVAKSVSDIRLSSVRLYNIPKKSGLFSSLNIPDNTFENSPLISIPESMASQYSGQIFMLENCQGKVPLITNQKQKNRDNAPSNASYLIIRATRNGKVLDYTIYLGENNTDDFNVRRNTSHTLNVTILGDNEVDARVHSYTLNVYDDLEEYSGIGGGYCSAAFGGSLIIDIQGNSHNLNFNGELEIISGNSSAFEFARDSNTGGYYSFGFYSLIGLNYYEINYIPSLIIKEESKLHYIVTITDEYDFLQTHEFTHQYANLVLAYARFGSLTNGKGSITANNALYTEKFSGTENIQALCFEDGCTFTATPAAGYKFSGWYSDSTFTKLLSTTAVFNFKPTSAFSWLYAKFEVDKTFVEIFTNIWDVKFNCEKSYTTDQDRESFTVPYGSRCTITVDNDVPLFNGWYDTFNTTNRKLISTEHTYSFTATDDMTLALGYINSIRLDASGTANCYIAQPSGGFRFYALTMGNGKATTGITPKLLSGNTAKVIWETYSTRGAVIKEAAYSPNNGLISFTMGGRSGNALIGLFDQNNVCVWSWHIWVTDYNPLSSAQTYTGGRIFMDRNIGALNNDYYDGAFRGLYYQWGRKDPFMYPYNTNFQSAGTITYHPDYSYDVTDPIAGYGKMTLDYAIAHPWTFMCGVYYNDDRENDTQNWLTPQNPNLWGNPSTMYNIVDGGSKSIYDPCPVGWRVPDRKAWSDAKMTYISRNSEYCYNMKTGSTTITLPLSGKIFNGNIVFNGQECHLWTNAPWQYNQTTAYWKSYSTALSILGSTANAMNGATRENGLPVRCVKE